VTEEGLEANVKNQTFHSDMDEKYAAGFGHPQLPPIFMKTSKKEQHGKSIAG
jgi:hypothetical protein